MAATDFPSNPIDGQEFLVDGSVYIWNSTKTRWDSASVTVASYDDGAVDVHLNTSVATDNSILTWDGSDYSWVSRLYTLSNSIGLGFNALLNDDNTNNQNVAVGNNSMQLNTSGNGNVAVGYLSMYANTTGFGNTAVGRESLQTLTTGQGNVGIGREALENVTVNSFNTGVGNLAAYRNAGEFNTAIGHASLGNFNSSGSYNTAVGANAGDALTTGQYNIIIGYGSDPSSATVSNEITLGNADITRFRIPGIQAAASDGDILTYDAANGIISLQAPPSPAATGGGTDEVFFLNSQVVTTNYTIPTGKNAMSAGPITINSGVTVTVSDGSRYVVI